jgi:hypothetical protein
MAVAAVAPSATFRSGIPRRDASHRFIHLNLYGKLFGAKERKAAACSTPTSRARIPSVIAIEASALPDRFTSAFRRVRRCVQTRS